MTGLGWIVVALVGLAFVFVIVDTIREVGRDFERELDWHLALIQERRPYDQEEEISSVRILPGRLEEEVVVIPDSEEIVRIPDLEDDGAKLLLQGPGMVGVTSPLAPADSLSRETPSRKGGADAP